MFTCTYNSVTPTKLLSSYGVDGFGCSVHVYTCMYARSRSIHYCFMVKRSPCHSRAGVHGVDRGNDISGLVQACRQGSIRHESSERHLLGNDDRSSVWPLPKVPGCVDAAVEDCNHTIHLPTLLGLTCHQIGRRYTGHLRHKHIGTVSAIDLFRSRRHELVSLR